MLLRPRRHASPLRLRALQRAIAAAAHGDEDCLLKCPAELGGAWRRRRSTLDSRDELAPLQSIELHPIPTNHERTAGYLIGID
jgi:hypothetical protein